MRIINYIITDEYDSRPLLHFLKGHIKLSTHIVQSLRHTNGAVLINKKTARLVDKVFAGDELELHLPEKTSAPLLWEKEISIIYEDEDLLVVNKPSGISTHPTWNHPNETLSNAVANYLIKSNQGSSAARAIGRLDKVTSGVMIFAKNAFSASLLNGNVEKTYNALVIGNMEKSGTIDAPIYRPDSGKTIRAVGDKGDKAVTHWKAIGNFKDFTLLEIKTETGRTHQIRVHCAHIGHPLLGDIMYGAPETEFLKRAALHCRSISLLHPITNEPLTFVAPLPDDMKKELEKTDFLVDKPDIIC